MWVVNYDEDGYLTRGNAADLSMGDSDVLVKVEASGINRADLLQKVGKYPSPKGASTILGLEVAGVVVDTGRSSSKWQKGDRVMGLLAGGGYAEYVSDHENLFMRIPDGLSYEQASAVPEAFLTAYQALFSLANIATNEHVLIHAGASGVGMAAIQLAKSQGATVYVTAGSQSKIDFCQQIGADFGVNYRDTPLFEEQILTVSDGHGIDLVVDVVGGSYVPQNINLLRTDGRYVLLAFMGGHKSEINLAKILSKRIHLIGSTLRARSLSYKKELIEQFSESFSSSLASGAIVPIIDSVYSFSQVNEAHDRMQQNLNMGKIVLSISQ